MPTRKEKVYLFRNVKYGYETVHHSDWSLDDPEYVRLGVAEVEFELESEAAQVKAAIKGLQAAKKKEMAESQARLNDLDARIQSLLAITHEPA